jgi:hypothetical protein
MAKALRIAVAARTGVTTLVPEVRVVSYLPSPDEQMPDAIVIGYMSADADEHQRSVLGMNRYDEGVSLTCRVQVTRPGAGQDVADAVRLRAQTLLAEVDGEVRTNLPTVGDQSWAGRVDERESVVIATLREGVGTMLCAIDFSVIYKGRTS